MSFEIIPAIDVSEGHLCFLGVGGPRRVDAFDADPLAAAGTFVAAGAKRLHVVDVDMAFTGVARNLDVVSRLAELGVPIQASGGLTSAEELRRALDAGAERVVLSSAAFADRRAVATIVAAMGERVVLGIEVRDGRIRPRGRGSDLDLGLEELLPWLAGTGAHRFLHTSVRRVGELAGPAVDEVGGLVEALGPRVIAAGGVTTIEHLRALAARGAEGSVVGRAALEGTLDVAAAVAELG